MMSLADVKRAMKQRGGFALIAALFLLVALSAVGLDAAMRSKNRRLAAANLLDQVRARAAARAGAEYAASRLTAAMLDRADELRAEAAQRNRRGRNNRNTSLTRMFRDADPALDPWRDPSELVAPSMAFGDAHYELRLHDAGATISLNDANEDILRRFFAQGLRVDFGRAEKLAQSILDWRDPDEIPRISGGEREQYMRAGAAVLPTNRPFVELDELRYVMGMTEDLYLEARPYLRLIGSGTINVNAASVPVLLSLPGMTESAADEIVRLRDSGQAPRDEDELFELLPPNARAELEEEERAFGRRTTFTTEAVEIIAEGWIDGSPIRSRVRMILVRSNAGAVLAWSEIE